MHRNGAEGPRQVSGGTSHSHEAEEGGVSLLDSLTIEDPYMAPRKGSGRAEEVAAEARPITGPTAFDRRDSSVSFLDRRNSSKER